MKEYKMKLPDALCYVQQRRPIVSPNLGFMKQLREYQEVLEKIRK